VNEVPFDLTELSIFRAKLGVKLHTELCMDILRQIDAVGFLDSKNQSINAISILGGCGYLQPDPADLISMCALCTKTEKRASGIV